MNSIFPFSEQELVYEPDFQLIWQITSVSYYYQSFTLMNFNGYFTMELPHNLHINFRRVTKWDKKRYDIG